MYTAELFFRCKHRSESEQTDCAISGLLVALERNGQIISRDWASPAVRGGYAIMVGLPERDSLRSSLFSKGVRETLRGLKKHGMEAPRIRVIGADLDSNTVCGCRKPAEIILETGYLTTEVPLRCGKCRGNVPLYRVSHTSDHGDYEDVILWTLRYRALDKLWIDSGVGEQLAYRELSRHDSDLSKAGRGVCRRIEQRRGIPAYYYLYRWAGQSIAAERKRLCPSCGRKWLLDPAWHGRYDFRCDRCRLVSNVGFDVR